MKKIIVNIISLLLFCAISLSTIGCTNDNSGGNNGNWGGQGNTSNSGKQEHDVVLVLVNKDGTKTRKILTSWERGATIYNPSDYKIYPSLIDGYVVENDIWYSTETLSSSVYFPYTMPDKNLELYASVRPLTNLRNVNFANAETIKSYFSTNAQLQDEDWNTPNEENETSYYEISEYSVASIKNILRYYPATQKIMLLRGYSKSNNMGGMAVIQDEFSIGITVNLANKTILCKGIYSRTGISSSSASGGSVVITYNIDEISIDDTSQPLFPNFATVNYTYTISNATNYNKMQELWNSDGYDYAENCYSQANTLLKSLNKKILVFS